MNDKQKAIYKVLDIVVKCCVYDNVEGKELTAEAVLSNNRSENIVMTRCIFVTQLLFLGYSRSTIARVLNRTERGISVLLENAHQLRIRSFAYRIAEAECTLKIKELMNLF